MGTPVALCLLWFLREFPPRLVACFCMACSYGESARKLSPKCVKVARPTLFGYIETREEFEFYVKELFTLLQSGQLKVNVHKVYPLQDAAQAHIDLEGRKTTGKLFLKP